MLEYDGRLISNSILTVSNRLIIALILDREILRSRKVIKDKGGHCRKMHHQFSAKNKSRSLACRYITTESLDKAAKPVTAAGRNR